jgi:hypothetical protein
MSDAQITKNEFPLAISNTMREAFVVCPQKFFRGYVQKLVPSTPNIHLTAGGAFAKGLETTRRSFYEQHLSTEDSIELGYAALQESYANFDIHHGYTDHNKNFDNLAKAFYDYFMEYKLDTDTMRPYMTPDGKAALEFSFAIPLPIPHPVSGDPILYAGKFDMLGVRNGEDLWVVDEKTTSQLGAQWNKQWDLNSQFTGYCFAARHLGYPVQGAMIRGVGLLKTKISHVEVPLSRAQWQIDRWYNQMLRDIRLMIAMWESDPLQGSEFSYALGSACTSYGECPYKRLCESRTPEDWIEQYYKQSDYNPLRIVVED